MRSKQFLLSGRVPVTNVSNVPSDRYSFLHLSDAEPSLGTAQANGWVLVYDTEAPGKRLWSNNLITAYDHANSSYRHANAAFIRANNSLDANNGGTVTGDVRIQGNLTVNGTTTYVNTQTLLIADNILTLNAAINQASAPILNAGIEVDRGSSPNVYILWNETIDKWTITNDGTGYYGIASDAAESYANSAFIKANASFSHANAAFSNANAAFAAANSSYNTANAAFIRANNSLNANVGGQVTGDVVVVGNLTSNTLTTTGSNGSITGANAIFTNYIFAANGNVDLYIYSSLAYAQSNAALAAANASFSNANGAFAKANAAFANANGAFAAANAAYIHANSGFIHSNAAFNHANSAYESQNATGQYANAAFTVANGAFIHANSGFIQANASFDHANASFANANGAFAAANAAYIHANSGFIHANSAYESQNATGNVANSAFINSNAAFDHANSGFIKANASFDHANAAFANANGAFAAANAAYIHANSGFIHANAAFDHANSSYQSQNATGQYANAAFTVANGAFIHANSGFIQANAAFNHANSAYESQNATGQYANAAFTVANGAFIHANSGFIQANSAYESQNATGQYANAAFIHSNAAYDFANTRFSAAGGTISGNVTVTSNLTVLGNVTFVGNVTSLQVTGNSGQFFGDAANGFNALYAGIPVGYDFQPQTVFQASANENGYAQINIQNINGGGDASGDYVATADNGTEDDTYIDMGIGSSTHSDPEFTLVGPNDGYLYVHGNTSTSGGDLVLGTFLPQNDVIIAAGGMNSENEQMRIIGSSNTINIRANLDTSVAKSVVLGPVANVHITGGSNDDFVRTDGAGNLSFAPLTSANVIKVLYAETNAAFIQANSAYQSQNATGQYANSAFVHANSGFIQANAAFNHANSAYESQNATGQYANAAFVHANSGFIQANASYNHANAAFAFANTLAGGAAIDNVARDAANSAGIYANGAFVEANSGYNLANSIANNSTVAGTSNVANYVNLQGKTGSGLHYLVLANAATGNIAVGGNTQLYYQPSADTLYAQKAAFGQSVQTSSLLAAAGTILVFNTTATTIRMGGAATTINIGNAGGITNVFGTLAVNGVSVIGFTQGAYNTGNSAFIQANASFDHANAAFAAANNVFPQIQPAFNTANAAFLQANAAFIHANSAYESQNATGQYANSAFVHANAAFNHANAAYVSQNATGQYANSAFVHANSAYESQNATGQYANAAFIHANSAYQSQNATGQYANSAFVHANSAYESQNATGQYANSAFIQANSAYESQNATGQYANAAFIRANNSLNANVGGQVTGDVLITGNLIVVGQTVYANTQTVLIGDNIITLNAAIDQTAAPTMNAGIEVDRGTSANVYILWNEGQQAWQFTNDGVTYENFGGGSAGVYANGAFVQANAAFNTGNSAFIQANAAFEKANSAAVDTWVRNQANSSFYHANGAYDHANAAFDKANTAAIDTWVRNQANGAYNHANAAYAKANTTANGTILSLVTTGDGVNSTFALGFTPTASNAAITVSIGGIIQTEDLDYTITPSNSTISFSSPPPQGEIIRAAGLAGIVPYFLDVANSAGAVIKAFNSVGDGVTVDYNIGFNPITANNLFVFVGGVAQPDSAYTVNPSTNTVTFGTAPGLNENIRITGYDKVNPYVITYQNSNVSVSVFETTANGLTNTFALGFNPQAPETLLVTIDGVVQPITTYSVNTTSNTISFIEAPVAGENVRVATFYTAIDPYYIQLQATNTTVATFETTANGLVNTFNMGFMPVSNQALTVAIDGVLQAPSTYTINGQANTITFLTTPSNGEYISVVTIGATNVYVLNDGTVEFAKLHPSVSAKVNASFDTANSAATTGKAIAMSIVFGG